MIGALRHPRRKARFSLPDQAGRPLRPREAPPLPNDRSHVTALYSPTRAAVLTGRNHPAVGFGSIGELSIGSPGYSASFPKVWPPFPRRVQDNGPSTAAFDKRYRAPDHQQRGLQGMAGCPLPPRPLRFRGRHRTRPHRAP
jgi:arylsulfatase A-like enzyme